MEEIVIVWKVRFNDHKSVIEKFRNTEHEIEIQIDDMEIQDLPSHLLEMGFMKCWCNNSEYSLVGRWIKESKLTEVQREEKIKALQFKKKDLLDKHGLFGGGKPVNDLHNELNRDLEALGVMENETLSYQQYLEM